MIFPLNYPGENFLSM